jgi:hypothetical protein
MFLQLEGKNISTTVQWEVVQELYFGCEICPNNRSFEEFPFCVQL